MRPKLTLSLLFALSLSLSILAVTARAEDDDPAKGKFTLEEATKGLSGSGPLTAKIETTQGTFTCELYEKQTPITVANFVGLARGAASVEGPQDRTMGEEAVLRRPHLPPRDPRLHDPGRRSRWASAPATPATGSRTRSCPS